MSDPIADSIRFANASQAPGNTPLTPDELAGLRPSLATKGELDEFERSNILEANRWAFSPRVLKREDPFIEPYLRELHRRMFGETWTWAGRYRKTDKNLGAPFHQILNGIAAILGDVHYWLENETFDIDEIAIRYHHRLVRIHPFPNGNGRHARLLADIIAVKNGRERFTWGLRELIEARPAREEYIRSLKAADTNNDDIRGLLNFARS
jgi:Fic-DOC domain mobile mystery protein B